MTPRNFLASVIFQRAPVETRRRHLPAETGRLMKAVAVVGGVAVELFRNTADIDAGTAQAGLASGFGQGHARATLRGHARGAYAAAAAADDTQVGIKIAHFLLRGVDLTGALLAAAAFALSAAQAMAHASRTLRRKTLPTGLRGTDDTKLMVLGTSVAGNCATTCLRSSATVTLAPERKTTSAFTLSLHFDLVQFEQLGRLVPVSFDHHAAIDAQERGAE